VTTTSICPIRVISRRDEDSIEQTNPRRVAVTYTSGDDQLTLIVDEISNCPAGRRRIK
jgi:hypothetical protein